MITIQSSHWQFQNYLHHWEIIFRIQSGVACGMYGSCSSLAPSRSSCWASGPQLESAPKNDLKNNVCKSPGSWGSSFSPNTSILWCAEKAMHPWASVSFSGSWSSQGDLYGQQHALADHVFLSHPLTHSVFVLSPSGVQGDLPRLSFAWLWENTELGFLDCKTVSRRSWVSWTLVCTDWLSNYSPCFLGFSSIFHFKHPVLWWDCMTMHPNHWHKRIRTLSAHHYHHPFQCVSPENSDGLWSWSIFLKSLPFYNWVHSLLFYCCDKILWSNETYCGEGHILGFSPGERVWRHGSR